LLKLAEILRVVKASSDDVVGCGRGLVRGRRREGDEEEDEGEAIDWIDETR